MELWEALALFASALVGGALNSIAGGGSFITFPVLLFTGMPPIQANATNTMALWPGSIAGAYSFRSQLSTQKQLLPTLAFTSLTGGIIGAVILLMTPERVFESLIPWLLLAATLIFSFGNTVTTWLRTNARLPSSMVWLQRSGSIFLQLVIAIYGGYFGAGIGILMLALLSLMGLNNIHEMNALKTILATAINGIAVATFVIAGIIVWPQALLMLVAAIIGGYAGAHYSQRLPQLWVRRAVMATGFAMTLYFFVV